MQDGDERRSGPDKDDERSDLADVLQFRPGGGRSATTPGGPGLRAVLRLSSAASSARRSTAVFRRSGTARATVCANRKCEALGVSDGPRYYVFLRAINTGSRRLSNEQVAEPFIREGFDDVAAYQAAGNVALRCADEARVSTESLDPVLGKAYGFETPAFVRRADELRAIVDACPFTDEQLTATEGRVQLTFLRDEPDDWAIASVGELVPTEDRVVVSGREWFWLPQTGVSASRLPVGGIERLIGPMTMRTLGTVQRMLTRFGD
jgi:uncharacterized protein (DUF1697 family)